MIAAFALCALLAFDGPRQAPSIPIIPHPWQEIGNRRARRRDAKQARVR